MNPEQRPPMAAPIRPQARPPSVGVRPPGPGMPAARPPLNVVPGAAGQPAFSPAAVPRPVHAQPLRPPPPQSVPRPPIAQQAAPPQPQPAVNNLVAPMANMNLQQPHAPMQPQLQQQQQQSPRPPVPMGSPSQPPANVPTAQRPTAGRPKRIYAVNPEVAAATMPSPNAPGMSGSATPPWPHGLQPNRPPAVPPAKGQHHSLSAAAGVGYTQGPYTNTSQQLPPELRPPQQPRPRIDPDQMPAPVQVREQDAIVFGDKFFGTVERERIPLATTNYIGLDQGNANPRYIRATVDKIPVSSDLAETSKLPLGLVVQPLAKPRKDEVPLQVVDHGAEGPVRCTRCRAYISPWCTFVQGGSKFICGICSHSNDVPEWYFSNVDMSGRRIDHEQRPELRYGSVEFEVPADYYSSRKPTPLSYVFAIDVSAQAVKSGLVEASCEALRETLYGKNAAESSRLQRGNRIGLITFDRAVHFYNLAPALTQAQMLVVPDIDDMFIPLQDGFLVDPEESKDIILELLQNLPTMFRNTIRPEATFSSAVRGGMQALKNWGGHLFVFQSTLPNYGADALKARDDKALYNTDKEKQLLNTQSDAYKELGKECIKNGVCVHTWLFPAQYTDVATLGVVSSLTGGDVRYYPNFSVRDTPKIVFQLNHDIHRETGFDGVLRIRCSDGLQVIDHYGNCNMSTYTDMELAGIDEDKAIAAVLKHDSKLDVGRGVNFQCALLYTTRSGYRRVRVHNLSLAVSNQIAEVFRSGDEDATIGILLRKAIFDSYHKNRRDIHQNLTEQCVQILTAYRLNCAASTSAGQLILPEAFKLLPIYVHASLRSHALRGVGADMQIDLRSSGLYLLNSLGVDELVLTLYPRMFAVHNMEDDCGVADLGGQVKLPPMVRTSYERLDSKGAYLLDTGSDLYFWLGNRISSDFLHNVFGVERLDQVDPNMTTLPFLEMPLSQRINDIATQLQADRTRYLQLRIVRQEMDAIEFVFSTWMAEDRNAEVQTYVDYMCVLHRKIQDEMKRLNS